MLGKRKMLGLAVTNRSITAVEAVAANGGGRVSLAAEFVFPDGAGLQEPAPLGKTFRQFLRTKGFSASRCMIGMEANWLTAREKTLPPGAGESVAEILALMVEREFASDRKELAFDYTLEADTAGERSAILVAAPQHILNGLVLMAEAAGLTVAGITASTIALAGATNGSAAEDQLVLHLFSGGAELALQSKGALRMMRRLPLSVPPGRAAIDAPANGWLDDLTRQLRRVVSLLPGGAGHPATRELLIWDEAGLDEKACRALSERLELPVKLCEREPGLEAAGAASHSPGAQFSAAAAMALGALGGRPPAIDLLHSRLSPQKKLAIGRKLAWAGALAATLLVAGTVLALDWRNDSLEAAALATKLKVMAGDLDEARDTIAKVTYARPWYDRRPSYLDCVRELTLAFPQEGLIWTTSLAVQEDMRVVFSGKAVSESAVLDVLDRLQANRKLSDVKPLYIRQAGRDGREVAFAMSFTFKPSDGTWSSPSAKKPSSPRR
jgi:hypothetical protein